MRDFFNAFELPSDDAICDVLAERSSCSPEIRGSLSDVCRRGEREVMMIRDYFDDGWARKADIMA
jgi:hypothetical protein